MEETQIVEREQSLRDYVNLLLRRKTAVLVTFVMACSVGVVYTVLSKPVYRSSVRVVVKVDKGGFGGMQGAELLGLALSPTRDVQTQIEVLQGKVVFQEALDRTGIQSSSVTLTATQVGETDAIEIVVQSGRPLDAERFGAIVPDVYRDYVKRNRASSISNAIDFVKSRLKEETEKLTMAELSLQQFRRKEQLLPSPTEGDGTSNVAGQSMSKAQQLANLEGRVRELEMTLAGQVAGLESTQEIRRNLPAKLDTPDRKSVV